MNISFLEFTAALNFQMTEAQSEFARVAFDGGIPCGCESCLQLWGTWSFAAKASRKVVAACCGRGSGKTNLGGARALHIAMTIDLSKLAAREKALIPVIAPDLEAAQQTVRFALGYAEKMGLEILQPKDGGESAFSIRRETGDLVRIAARSASTRGRAGRGFSIPCAILDEACFFRDAASKVNDEDIFKAIKPRVMRGGQIVILSSPWTEAGLLYTLWKRNYGHPVDCLMAHAPTGMMRKGDEEVEERIALDRSVDPEQAAREYDAQFMTSNAKSYFDPRAVAQAFVPKSFDLNTGATKASGGDFAFKRNSTAFVTTQVFQDAEGKTKYQVLGLMEERPQGAPLRPSTICAQGASFVRSFGDDVVVADGHHRESVQEHLWEHRVTLTPAPNGEAGKEEVFRAARDLIHEGLVQIPLTQDGLGERLLRQLREVTVRHRAGGSAKIESPLWATGEHGDLASAFVLSLWRAKRLGPVMLASEKAPQIDPFERSLMRKADIQSRLRKKMHRWTGLHEEQTGERPIRR